VKNSFHLAYIIGSFVAAFIALIGILSESPLLYATVPGMIGGILAGIATVRFLKDKTDLAGFVATICGFIFYQAFQANPVTRLEFSASLQSIPVQDQVAGMVLGNLTTAILLISCRIASNSMHRVIRRWVPDPAQVSRMKVDRKIVNGFWIIFTVVALPNVLFGKVIFGAIDNIVFQRMAPGDAENFSGFTIWGGAVGASVGNMVLWATSLFLLWLYLLRSRCWLWMLVLSPLVLLWTASVGLHGSRTYLVTMGVAAIVYFLGSPQFGKKAFAYALVAGPVLFLLLQISTLFRSVGLQSFNLTELSTHMFEIRGNEGASSAIDGMQYFRTELVQKGLAPNPVFGFFRGLFERPFEGLMMPVPRSLFPWKAEDHSSKEYNLWFQNVRLGDASDQEFLGASPGLIGRELIKYGIFGPFTLFFWMGLLLALADRFFAVGAASDFHRICAAVLVAFIVAQVRDFVPVWFIPFLPAGVILGFIARKAKKSRPVKSGMAPEPSLTQVSGTAK
jgi:hypothetical protein